MNKSLKEKWVEALESGKYRRGRGSLKNEDNSGYCCLGVLCKVAGVEFDPEDSYLPSALAKDAQLSRDEQRLLAYANDGALEDEEERGLFKRYSEGKGAPFKSIAAYVRKNL